jgi:FkbM family methyltransferase
MTGKQTMAPVFRLYRAAQYLKITRHPGPLRILSKFPKLDLSVLEARGDGRVVIKGTDIDPTSTHCQFMLRGSDCVRRLMEEANATLKCLPDGVMMEAGGVRLKLETWEELFIATEIFAEGIYNLQFPDEFVLIDIGLNVGTASLFFAAKPSCQAIYAFEPFPRTIEKARVNFSLNPPLAKKITAVCEGVAARNFSAELDYFEEYKGSVGINGLPDYVTDNPASLKREKVGVQFTACAEVFAETVRNHPNTNLVCKIDCEGAEYEIVDNLAVNGLLTAVDYFMIEWHRNGAAPLEQSLAQSGFTLLSLSPRTSTFGMLYAWRPLSRAGKTKATAPSRR